MSAAVNHSRPASNELHITRVYDAPVKVVWDAWTDPQQVAQWWGPRGFTLTTHSKDLRPGGNWAYTMHGPDGTNYENKTIYHEVVEHSRLVYDHGGNDDRPPLFRVTVVFAEIDGKTRMDMTMTLPTAEAATEAAKFIRKAGGNATWDRLAEYLAKRDSGVERFVINRTFSADRETVFEMWANPDHLARWLPPVGLTMKNRRVDVRPGGSLFFEMTADAGANLLGRLEYLEIRRPDRIVYLQQFCDEREKPVRHPMAPTWPETMLTVVTFAEENPDQTRVTVTWEPYGQVTQAEIAAFVAERGGMTQGWTGSFDKLENLLATQ